MDTPNHGKNYKVQTLRSLLYYNINISILTSEERTTSLQRIAGPKIIHYSVYI